MPADARSQTVPPHRKKDALRLQWRLLAFGFLMTLCSAPGQTFFIALFGDSVRSELAISHTEFGALYSAATLLSALIILWSGRLVDIIPIPRFSSAVIVLLALSMLLFSGVNSALTLFIAFLFLRHLGQALMMLTASTTILRYLPQFAGRASALSGMGYVFGEATLPTIVVLLIAMSSWTTALQILALALVAVILPLTRFLLRDYAQRDRAYREQISKKPNDAPGAADEAAPAQQENWNRQQVVRDPHFYLLLPAILSQPLLFTGFIFHQGFILESRGWDMQWWATLFAAYALVAVIAKLAAGYAIDRWGAINLLPLGPVPLALGLIALGMEHSASAYFFFLGLGLSTGLQTTLSGPIWLSLYGSANLGSIKSLSSSATVFGTAMTPIAIGLMIDSDYSLRAISWIGVAYAASAILLVFTSRATMNSERLNRIIAVNKLDRD